VRDEVHVIGLAALLHDDLARLELLLHELLGQRAQRVAVREAAQQREFTEFGGDDLDLGAGLHEGDPAVAQGVRQAPVDPVGGARHIHPGQHPGQPAGADPLYLGFGLGGRGQIARGRGAEALLVLLRRRLGAVGRGRHCLERHHVPLPLRGGMGATTQDRHHAA
jgi:hypothetical protein